jgi:hypothetical protein
MINIIKWLLGLLGVFNKFNKFKKFNPLLYGLFNISDINSIGRFICLFPINLIISVACGGFIYCDPIDVLSVLGQDVPEVAEEEFENEAEVEAEEEEEYENDSISEEDQDRNAELDLLLDRYWGPETGSVTESDNGFDSDFELGVGEEENLPPYQEVEETPPPYQ